jgi:hypothetical protein
MSTQFPPQIEQQGGQEPFWSLFNAQDKIDNRTSFSEIPVPLPLPGQPHTLPFHDVADRGGRKGAKSC